MGPIDRIKAAVAKVQSDSRTYKQVKGSAAYNDKYVDCSEYGREIAMADGYDPGRSTWHQMKYYKEEGEWMTDINNVRKGDFLFWKGKDSDGNVFYHTGLAVEMDDDNEFTIAQSTRNGGGKSIHDKYKTNASGTLWAGSEYEMEFVGAGRPKDDVYAPKEDLIEVEVIMDGKSTTHSISPIKADLQSFINQLLEEKQEE